MRCRSRNNVNLIRSTQSGYICLELNVSKHCRRNSVPFDQKNEKLYKHIFVELREAVSLLSAVSGRSGSVRR